MNRRQFITLSGAASMAAVVPFSSNAQSAGGREYYELRQFIVENEQQRKGLDTFFKQAAIPALNRAGMKKVGVFYPEGLSPVYTLLTYNSLSDLVSLNERLADDSEFVSAGAEFINAPASAPAFKRMESSLMIAFAGMPKLETPVSAPGRVFQLRIYESPSVVTGLKKIEMFNDAGEIKLFRESGLNPVFFGETIAGAKMPNLTYMLGFNNMDEQKAAWKKFVNMPEWKRISGMPEYADKAILSGITNIPLTAAPYSQV
jgi:hypothetical protein